MASSSVVINDMLQCPICLETYRCPKYLPCLHTFCQSCLQSYISSQKDEETRKGGFHCPVCWAFTAVPKKVLDTRKWSEQIPNNHFISSLLDIHLMQTKQKFCDVCNSRDETKEAISYCLVCSEALCGDCDVYHKSFRLLRGHEIIPIDDMKREKPEFKANTVVYCQEHKTEPIKIFCKDHRDPCCNTCATIKHRKCEEVVSIEEAAQQFRISGDFEHLRRCLAEKSQNISSVLQKRVRNAEEFERQKSVISAEVSSLRSEIDSHFDNIEKSLKDDLDTREKNLTDNNGQFQTELERIKSSLDNCKLLLEAAVKYGTDIQCFVEYKKVKAQEDKLKKLLKEKLQSAKLFDLEFEKGRDADDILNLSSLGHISMLQNTVSDKE